MSTQPTFETETRTVKTLRADTEPVNTISVDIDASQTLVEGAILGRKNSRFTLTINATAGTYTLLVDGEETAAIAFDANAAAIQAALEALAAVGAGNVVVTGAGPFAIQFANDRSGGGVTLTSDATSLTGGTQTATVADATSGAAGRYVKSDPTATDGSQEPVAILAEDVTTAAAETARATAFDAGRFNKNAIDFGTHSPRLVEAKLRARGVFLVTAAASV